MLLLKRSFIICNLSLNSQNHQKILKSIPKFSFYSTNSNDICSWPLPQKLPLYVAGTPQFTEQSFSVFNKHTQDQPKVISNVSSASPELIENAIQQCVNAKEEMRKLPSYEKERILLALAEKMKENKELLAKVIVEEGGKTFKDALVEVERSITTITVSSQEATRIYGQYTPFDITKGSASTQGIIKRFPIGVISMISPFNFPLNLVAHKVGPAIAAGCPWILKPSERTPISSLLLGEFLKSVGLPKGSFSIVPCSRENSVHFVTNPNIQMISFTGSDIVGWKIKQSAPKKKVVLELGGNASCICTEDTNIDQAIQRISFGAFYQNGQSCISVQHLYVHDSIYHSLRDKLVSLTSQFQAGDPYSEKTFVTSMIDIEEAKRVEKWVNDAVSKGGKLLVGGKRQGAIFLPTIIENCPTNCEIYQREAFGPVMTIERYSSFKSVIDKVNSSQYGLQTGIFTRDLDKVFYAYEQLEVGGLIIGDIPSFRVDSQPYGGMKESGCGREGVKYSIEEMTEMKTLILRNAGNL